MLTTKMMRLTALPLAVLMVLGGCATTGKSAGAGALVGGALGGLIGAPSGRGLEGAAIGAALGAGVGLIVGDIKQRRLATREQVIEDYKQAGTPVPTEPTVHVQQMTASPEAVQYGQSVNVDGKYELLNLAPPEQRAGKLRVIGPDGTVLDEKVIDLEMEGVQSIELPPIKTNKQLKPGNYTVEVELKNGNATASRQDSFVIAENAV